MTVPLLDEAVKQVQALVSADGARLDVVEVSENPTQITLKLDLSTAGCAECVLPPSALLMTVSQIIKKKAEDNSINVVIDDPRNNP